MNVLLRLCISLVVAAQGRVLRFAALQDPELLSFLDGFGPTIAYLNASLAPYNVSMITTTHGFSELQQLVHEAQVDVVFSHASIFSCLESSDQLGAIATIRRIKRGKPLAYAGGIVFTKADNHDIYELADLNGKIIVAESPKSFTGLLAQWKEVHEAGLELLIKAKQIVFTYNPEAIVHAVLEGKGDVGFATSGTWEGMLEEDLAFPEAIRVLHQQHHVMPDGNVYPHKISTRLYPEWPLAAHPSVPGNLRTVIAQALFDLDSSDFVVQAGNYDGWESPASYLDVRALQEDLNIVKQDHFRYTCTDLAEDIVCPFGWVPRLARDCSHDTSRPCPTMVNYSFDCMCDPCQPACPEYSSLQVDGKCHCNDDAMELAGHCAPMYVVALELIVPIFAALIAFGVWCVYRQRKRADLLWHIKSEDLFFDEPPEVLGAGSFGCVLGARYRGTKVAVKRAYKSKSARRQRQALRRVESRRKREEKRMSVSGHNLSISQAIATQRNRDNNAQRAFDDAEMDINVAQQGASRRMSRGSVQSGGSTSVAIGFVGWIFGRSPDNKARSALMREMRVLSRLQHSNVCQLLGAVVEAGMEPLMVMEHLCMGSLHGILHNMAMEVDGEFIFNSLRDIVAGMRFLHASDIIHGDLKSMNCLVSEKFHVKVSDFGMASSASESGISGGTPIFMAPEILQGQVCTFKSDIYSFGITMYEVFSRKEPYEDEQDMAELINKIVRRKHRPSPPPKMPVEFVNLMKECTSADLDRRPSFDELERRTQYLEGCIKIGTNKKTLQADTSLLEEVFPKHIAEALREGRTIEAENHAEVTIFFSDIVGFTNMSRDLDPMKVSDMLDRLYTAFDRICDEHGLYKIETIGDAYMCVGNLFDPQPDHAARVAHFAIGALAAANTIPVDADKPEGPFLDIRCGFHSGPVVSNVVGSKTPRFCLFGSTVNQASRMESNSIKNCIHISDEAAKLAIRQDPDLIIVPRRPMIDVKGLGKIPTHWLLPDDSETTLQRVGSVDKKPSQPPSKNRKSSFQRKTSTASSRSARGSIDVSNGFASLRGSVDMSSDGGNADSKPAKWSKEGVQRRRLGSTVRFADEVETVVEFEPQDSHVQTHDAVTVDLGAIAEEEEDMSQLETSVSL